MGIFSNNRFCALAGIDVPIVQAPMGWIARSQLASAVSNAGALGIIETFGAAYISVPYKDAFAFLVLVMFLVFRPQGIFGERVAEKA